MFSWIIFLLICSFAPPNHGGTNSTTNAEDAHMGMRHHHVHHAKEAIVETFEIDNMVIDCVDIYKQPAFQHPLLVNHTLQLKPNYPTGIVVTKASHPWNSSKSCPEGSIPIERITPLHGQFSDDKYTLNMSFHKHHKYFPPQRVLSALDHTTVHEHSVIRVSGDHLYGGKAAVNVWNPKVVDKISSFSVSQLWITTESYQDSLEAGWAVFPRYYGTAEPRFFIFQTSDGHRTGCYNLDCPGFVQTNHRTIIGAFLRPVSVYGGKQYVVDIEIFKDKTSGNWWVRLQGVDMGYWPKEIAPTLAEGGTFVDFGGEVTFPPSGVHPSLGMGSGHFSVEGAGKASFFGKIQVIPDSSSYAYQTPQDFKVFTDNVGCYDLLVGEKRDGLWGLYFFYGGPGVPSEKCR